MLIAALIVLIAARTELRSLPWRSLLPWAIIAGVANAEATLINAPAASSRLALYLQIIPIFLAFVAAGSLLSGRTGLPPFPAARQAWLPRELLLGCLSGLLFGGLILWTSRFGSDPEYDGFISNLRQTPQPLWSVWLASLQAGMTEETIYRLFGINLVVAAAQGVLPRLRPALAVGLGILLTSLLFGALPMHSWWLALLVGSAIGLLYRYRGLVHVVTLHVVGDLLVLSVLVLSR